MRTFATVPAVLALLAAACSDLPSSTSPAPEPSPGGFHAELSCTASVREGKVSCADDAPGGGSGSFARLIIGGQNVYVRLASSGAAYNASDSIFQVNVTVQNLMTQAFGTPDGATDTGLRVFFYTGPDVTGGTGSVSVDNEDGSDTFLTAVTPYFAYRGVLNTNDVSEAKAWRFKVGPQVETFSFKVFVQGQLPHEGSLLLFRPWYEVEDDDPLVWGIWGASASEVFAVGESGLLLRYTNDTWVKDEALTEHPLLDVWGSSATDVFAVGEDLTILHWDGTAWEAMDSGLTDGGVLYGVWGSGPDDVWAVGQSAWDDDGGIILHYDGEQWTHRTGPWHFVWYDIWGSAANDVFVIGPWGDIVHYDGTAWTRMRVPWPGPDYGGGIWGLSSTDVYAYHQRGVHHYDGVEWRPMSGFNDFVHSVWGTAPDNLFVATWGGITHWDGSTWTQVGKGIVTELWGFGTNDVVANVYYGVSRGTR